MNSEITGNKITQNKFKIKPKNQKVRIIQHTLLKIQNGILNNR